MPLTLSAGICLLMASSLRRFPTRWSSVRLVSEARGLTSAGQVPSRLRWVRLISTISPFAPRSRLVRLVKEVVLRSVKRTVPDLYLIGSIWNDASLPGAKAEQTSQLGLFQDTIFWIYHLSPGHSIALLIYVCP